MCLGGKRVYVFDEVYDELLEQLTRPVGKYEPGLGWEGREAGDPHRAVAHVRGAGTRSWINLQDAVDGGGEVVLGGDQPRRRWLFREPDGRHQSGARLARSRARRRSGRCCRSGGGDLDEAIRLANDSEYGLGASVWTNDIRVIHRVANEMEAGMKWVNQFHYGYDELPFGGVKQSGYGKEHGQEDSTIYLEDISVVVGGLEYGRRVRSRRVRRVHHPRQAAGELLRP